MQIRRIQRHLKGTQRKTKKSHHVALFVLLLIVYGLSPSYMDNGTLTTTLTIQVWQMVAVGAWFLLIVVLLSLLEDSIFFAAAVWMLVYWPLLAIIASILVTGSVNPIPTTWITVVFVSAQCLTLAIVLVRHYLYPNLLQSDWFHRHVGVARYWKVQLLSSTSMPGTHGTNATVSWTFTYHGAYHWTQLLGHTHRHTCQYEGETVPEEEDQDRCTRHGSHHPTTDTSVPHGQGRWLDDSHGGEVLSSACWRHGVPSAPFLSRRYGTGDAFRAVPIAYFLAADDEFDSSKLVPTNQGPAKCGVASVECSIQGAFYNHLPSATSVFGPVTVPEERVPGSDAEGETTDPMTQNGAWLQECFRHMKHIVSEQEEGCTTIGVSTGDPRGVQVLGHVYARTNQPFSSDAAQIIIQVKRDQDPTDKSDVQNDHAENNDSMEKPVSQTNEQARTSLHRQTLPTDPKANQPWPRLEVQDWLPSPRKEALIFIPGFNSCLKKSLNTLGQLLAMTKLSAHVYPIMFQWPVAQVLTYRYASAIAASERNRAFFLQLVRGLAASGIDHVHLMSHSMGVQTLLSAFQNKTDGSPSEVSNCFQLADGGGDEGLLTCKSITMLNPDFPLAAFVDHAFLSIRRVCSHITIVGDRGDQALWFSQLINGTAKYFGYPQPDILNGTSQQTTRLHQQVMGRHIDGLCFPEREEPEKIVEEGDIMDPRMLFQKRKSQMSMATSDHSMEYRWLDVDVIDTTWLDTNIKDLRHSGFNVNPILLKDLEELILTGRRAAERSTLLYREGNVFSYCHAPAFVTM